MLRDSDLQRRRIAGTWMWMFPALPEKEWMVTWEGYRERVSRGQETDIQLDGSVHLGKC